ncbi:MAG: hypothetical protein Q9160_004924 [Pyrenula sp. 1 TL-2023]
MGLTLPNRLLRRELGQGPAGSSIKGIYGDRRWVDDLDIVNELGGHTGCVNALSWSKSGRLLASGSDDTHLNIWSYNSDSSAKQFALNTSVSTGHSQNIFSVKFMPQSNDRTVVTAAGDSQVRVFDIEYGERANVSANTTHDASVRSRRFNDFFHNTRYMNEGSTNARIFRSHGDRVKRIITESSPYVFLTCSEDGEVRQWDTRQPSSAYPPPRGGQGFMSMRRSGHDATNVPPPLISYKDYQLDLNTISCSGSQPHYIALGGAHLHCFLHDRRMLGRSLASEQGRPSGRTPDPGSGEDDMMGQATRCVRRFAPDGKRQVTSDHLKHITACKISDANPNEMVVSWSGDHIYSFDLVQTPDAREKDAENDRIRSETKPARIKASRERKRKRAQAASTSSLHEAERAHLRQRRDGDSENALALRVRYGNGEIGDFPLPPGEDSLETVRESLLNERQRLGRRIAKAIVKLRKTLFDFESTLREASRAEQTSMSIDYTPAFTEALGMAINNLDQIDGVISDWRYPVTQDSEEIAIQQTLRKNRAACRRFVQASGTLSKVLGGRLQTPSMAMDPRLHKFCEVVPTSLERDNDLQNSELFAYDFMRAILLWLDGGPSRMVAGFSRASPSKRYPLDPGDGVEALQTKLFSYLLTLSSQDIPVVDIDASRFEIDENRMIFRSQRIAVRAFSRAVTEYDLGVSDNSGSKTDQTTAINSEESPGAATSKPQLNSDAARRFWGIRVARSVLMTAGQAVNYEFANRAFGGVGIHIQDDEDSDIGDERVNDEVFSDAMDEDVEQVSLVAQGTTVEEEQASNSETPTNYSQPNCDFSSENATSIFTGNGRDQRDILARHGTPSTATSDRNSDETSPMAVEPSQEDDNVEEEDDDDNDDFDDTSDEDGDDVEDSDSENIPLYSRRIGFSRSSQRARVEYDKPCSTHTQVYRGHCNVKTVKDVNFYGLNDEYVVSGSDSGHFFIWDKKTGQCVNILQGDGEVVNVIQGHPYEPMIACSGIDSTIKIFSPDQQMQEDARNGVNLLNPGGAGTSSLRFAGRRMRQEPTSESSGLESKKCMDKYYQIVAENDTARQGGLGDAVLTRTMLSRLAMHAIQRTGDGAQAIVIDDNCSVM